MPPTPRRVTLEFRDDGGDAAPHRDLSVVLQIGDDLWLAADENASLERLSPVGEDRYGRHESFALADYVDLPAGPDEEVDVEGMSFDGHSLWVVGSHSARRGKADADGRHPRKELERLATVKRSGNRYLLARIPLAADPARPDAEAYVPCVRAPGGEGPDAARLAAGRRSNVLRRALRDDEHLAPYLDIPSKDNGFDVEGLAVLDGRVFVGLRGPVVCGWAVILELAVEDAGRGRLALAPVGRKKRPYRKHLLDLRGSGVREISADGDALLVLAGPTMKLDGDAALFRWTVPPAGKKGDTLTGRDALPRVLELPYGAATRRAWTTPRASRSCTAPAARARCSSPTTRPATTGASGAHGIALDVFTL
jgi:hypothetical protein